MRIGLFTGFMPASCVELYGSTAGGDTFYDRFIKSIEISAGVVAKFFNEIRVTEDFEEAAFYHVCVNAPVDCPCFFNIRLCPAPDPNRVVEVPFLVNIMYRADKVVPWVACFEGFYPRFTAW